MIFIKTTRVEKNEKREEKNKFLVTKIKIKIEFSRCVYTVLRCKAIFGEQKSQKKHGVELTSSHDNFGESDKNIIFL